LAAGGSLPASAHPASTAAFTDIGREAAAQKDVIEIRRRHRGVAFGFHSPHFSFYVGPRYYHPYPYYHGYPGYYPRYYHYPRYYKRCWRSHRRGRWICRWYRRW
jgi:hypothetical protein